VAESPEAAGMLEVGPGGGHELYIAVDFTMRDLNGRCHVHC